MAPSRERPNVKKINLGLDQSGAGPSSNLEHLALKGLSSVVL